MQRRVIVAVGLVACWKPFGPPRPAQRAFEPQIQLVQLDNGLRVVALPDATATEIQLTMQVGVGSIDDPPGGEGLAHLVEHLMFQQVLDGESLFAKLERHATSFNGFTELEATTFSERAPPADLDRFVAVEAARLALRCETIDAEVFAREREVVRNELREKSQLLAITAGIHAGLFQTGHPYHSRRDSPESVTAITREQACAFADAHYALDNAVLVVSGNVTAGQLEQAARRAFAAIPRRPHAARPALPRVARQTLAQAVPIDTTAFVYGWPLPAAHVERARASAGVDPRRSRRPRGAWRGAGSRVRRRSRAGSASLDALDERAATRFRTLHYRPDAMTIIIAGGFDSKLADTWIDHVFATWSTDRPPPQRYATAARLLPTALAAHDDTTMIQLQIALPVAGDREHLLLAAELIDQAIADVRHQLGAAYSLSAFVDSARLASSIRIAGHVDASRVTDAVTLVRDRLAAIRALDGDTASRFVAARRRVAARLQSIETSSAALAALAERDTAADRPIAFDLELAGRVRMLTLRELAPTLQGIELSRGALLLRGPEGAVKGAYEAIGLTPRTIDSTR
jgi:predicted Zn-dependent peptidase